LSVTNPRGRPRSIRSFISDSWIAPPFLGFVGFFSPFCACGSAADFLGKKETVFLVEACFDARPSLRLGFRFDFFVFAIIAGLRFE
jgi:hypothetical protein